MVSGAKCPKNCHGCLLGDLTPGGCRRSAVDAIDWTGHGATGVKHNDHILLLGHHCVNKPLPAWIEKYVYLRNRIYTHVHYTSMSYSILLLIQIGIPIICLYDRHMEFTKDSVCMAFYCKHLVPIHNQCAWTCMDIKLYLDANSLLLNIIFLYKLIFLNNSLK